ncbi:uncharacterized protein RHOBADRAFT_44173 [Rhodotorula graminis WP1]|uniref:Uncharacterized protein n=1 Tax=Rhodotorula graminis (strain WP1) TaxID=578459 RepID=A0A194S1Q2_RHOGW|nr:uncharacterized protein RHOBADRAFT_44173 [Rhodotorula graminis WP1]KPV74658.1 hypothetical protein RHOBADRAFT_44173 [Rhodotorula graminis WP1]
MSRLRKHEHEVGTLAGELAKLVPRHREEHESGQLAVKHFDVAGHINRLCSAWIQDAFILKTARLGLGEYRLSDDDVFVLRGKGTPDHPLVIVVASFDEIVRAVTWANGAFERFQIPHAQRKVPDGQLYKLAGPSLIAHDAVKDKRPEQSKPRGNSFAAGSYGGPHRAPYCIDTAACQQWDRAALVSLRPARGTRIVWQLVHTQPSIGTIVECAESPDESPLDDHGALRPDATPATEVAWLFDVEIETNAEAYTQQAQERATETLSCHIIFSRRSRQAVERARSRLDLSEEASLTKARYIVGARGAARVRAFV